MQKEAHLGIGGELVMPEDCLADRSLHTWVKAPVRDWERNPAIIITHQPRLTIVLREDVLHKVGLRAEVELFLSACQLSSLKASIPQEGGDRLGNASASVHLSDPPEVRCSSLFSVIWCK